VLSTGPSLCFVAHCRYHAPAWQLPLIQRGYRSNRLAVLLRQQQKCVMGDKKDDSSAGYIATMIACSLEVGLHAYTRLLACCMARASHANSAAWACAQNAYRYQEMFDFIKSFMESRPNWRVVCEWRIVCLVFITWPV